jgi:putative transposase
MPRPKRVVIAGIPHHVIQRGNNGAEIFKKAKDYDTYLGLLCKFLNETACDLLAYALIPNHVHLLVRPPDEAAFIKLMRKLGVTYALYFQTTYQVTGHVFESRFKSFPVEEGDYLWEVVRYIDQNPQNAGLTKSPQKYSFSSAAAHIAGETDGITTHLPFDKEQTKAFAEYLAQPGSKKEMKQIIESIRRNKPFGSAGFLAASASKFGLKYRKARGRFSPHA